MSQPDLEPYDGKWVAVRADRVVAHADDEEALRAHPAVRDDDDVYPIGDPPSGFYLINV
jgi:lactam utilization protein B